MGMNIRYTLGSLDDHPGRCIAWSDKDAATGN